MPSVPSPAPIYPAVLLAGAAVVAACVYFVTQSRATVPVGTAASQPSTEPRTAPITAASPYLGAPPLPFLTNMKSDRPLHTLSKYPPHTRIPIRDLPRQTQGIPCPDGSFLPFLNGMTWAPAVHRDPAYGPVPPIVALVVDVGGIEWWEHADGSTTTCHYHEVTVGDAKYFDPVTRHGTPKPASQVLGTDQPPLGQPGTGSGGQAPGK